MLWGFLTRKKTGIDLAVDWVYGLAKEEISSCIGFLFFFFVDDDEWRLGSIFCREEK